MFKFPAQHSNNLKGSVLPFRNPPSLIRPQQGYHNIDSPMKAAFRLQTSPRKNLSPMKFNTDSRLTPNRSRSPILLSRRDDQGTRNGQLSPFRRTECRQAQEDCGHQKHISFTNMIRRNSNTLQYDPQNQSQFNRTMEHSTSNYLQTDRNNREDVGLFKKLAIMLESNKSGKSSFVNSGISDNSVKYKGMPQSCRNQNSSNKKVFIKNVMTVQSIQSPEEKDFGNEYDECPNIETKCYSEYERMTSECPALEKRSSNTSRQQNVEPRLEKKQSKRAAYQVPEEEVLSFKKISFGNQKVQDQNSQIDKNAIDYHLTNSFGTTANLKNQIMGCDLSAKKPSINPFEHIINDPHNQIEPVDSIKRSVSQSQDSMFASLKMLLEKVSPKLPESSMHKENESINISIMSENEDSELDMSPYLEKRR